MAEIEKVADKAAARLVIDASDGKYMQAESN